MLIPDWLIGACVCVASNALTALGLVAQKYSHMQNELVREKKKYYRQPLWVIGLAVFLFGQVINLAAMALCPQAMLSCLGGMSLVFNTVYARIILGEQLRLVQVMAMATMMVGAVLVVVSAPVPETPVVVYPWQVTAALLKNCFVIVTLTLAVSIGILAVVAKFNLPRLKPVVWGLTCAVCGSYSITFFKCAAEIVALSSYCWQHFEIYCLGVLACWCALMQVHTMNLALRWGNAVTVVPTFFALGVLFQLALSQLAFQELSELKGASRISIFCMGVFLVVASTIAIVTATSLEPVPQGEDEEEQSMPLLGSRPKAASEPSMFRRSSSLLDVLSTQEFRASFDDERIYTVSFAGPMGIA